MGLTPTLTRMLLLLLLRHYLPRLDDDALLSIRQSLQNATDAIVGSDDGDGGGGGGGDGVSVDGDK